MMALTQKQKLLLRRALLRGGIFSVFHINPGNLSPSDSSPRLFLSLGRVGVSVQLSTDGRES